MVRIRKTQLMEESQAAKRDFVEGSEKFRLSDLSLDELANRYFEIDTQSRLLKGAILLEARSRFKADIEFGNWIKGVELFDTYHRSQLHNLMNLARFFNQRDMDGISVTVGYEISKPGNADIADKVYQVALNKNLSVAQIKAEIAKAKGLLPESVNEGSGEPELMPLGDISRFMEQVMADIGELPVNEAIRVLKECEKQLKKNSKTVSPVED
jgi:hypothetical protein